LSKKLHIYDSIKMTSADDYTISQRDEHIDDCEKKEEIQLPSNADKEIQDPYRMLKKCFAGAQKIKRYIHCRWYKNWIYNLYPSNVETWNIIDE
jgi:hypothetical protein